MALNPFLSVLEKGDLRTTGEVDTVVKRVLRKSKEFDVLFPLLTHQNPAVRMRAADAVEKISIVRPDLLTKYKKTIFRIAEHPQQEVRWHIAQLFPRLKLSQKEMVYVEFILNKYLVNTKSNIVRVNCLQALTDLALQRKLDRAKIKRTIRFFMDEVGTPSIRTRGKKLLKDLEK